jgi:peptidoglycan/LPS O-acetylase OafA/YrhL
MVNSLSNRNNNFNLLRLGFAIFVLLAHAPELIDGDASRELLSRIFHTLIFGGLAVDGFFLLSGYLIVQSWENTPHISDFIRNRVLRIYPAFSVATFICALIAGPLGSTSPSYFSDLSIAGVTKNALLLMPPVLPAVFEGTPHPIMNGAMWTVRFEFICYFFVLVAGVVGLTKKRQLVLALTVGLLGTFAIKSLGFLENLPGYVIWHSPLIRLGSFFLIGACFYLWQDKVVFSGKHCTLAAIVACCGLFSAPLHECFLATAGAYVLFYFAFKRMASTENFNRLPDISYGTYLYGFPIQKLLLWYIPNLSPWILFLLSCTIALVFGLMSWYGIEKPFLKLKRRIPDKTKQAGAMTMQERQSS